MIRITGLTKRYGTIAALSGLDLVAVPGRVLGFLGPNGSGKSTTLRCLVGLARADGGQALIDGRAYRELDRPFRTVGALLDPEAHHPDRSGREHLRVLCDAAGLRRSRADEVLELVELSSAAGRRAGGYSLGMRQRLHLAAALLGDPPILVLDEPTNGLDPQGIRWLRDFLRALAAEGRTIVLSSHVLPEVAQTVDDITVVVTGRTVAAGALGDVLGQGQHLRVRTPDPEALNRVAAAAGATIVGRDPTAGDIELSGISAERLARAAFEQRLLLTLLEEPAPDLEARYFELTGGER